MPARPASPTRRPVAHPDRRKASSSCPPRHDSSVPTGFAASRTSTSRPSWRCASAWPPPTSSVDERPGEPATPKAVVGRDPRASGEFLVRRRDRRAWPRPGSTSTTPTCCPRRRSPSSPPTRTPTSASCSRPRTTRCPTTGSSSSPPAATSSTTRSRTRSRPASTSTGSAPRAPTSGGSSPCRDGHTRYISHLLDGPAQPPRRHQGRHRRRPRRGAARSRPRCSGWPAPRSIEIGTEPDGLNINDGYGSTHLDHLKAAVVARGRRPRHRPRR